MFVFTEGNRLPIKVWLDSIDNIDEGCIAQARNLASLPFIHRHVALCRIRMRDTGCLSAA